MAFIDRIEWHSADHITVAIADQSGSSMKLVISSYEKAQQFSDFFNRIQPLLSGTVDLSIDQLMVEINRLI